MPVLLLQQRRLVKTERFADPAYVGDPVNVVKIFNEKEVDEIVFLDINATARGDGPAFGLIEELASECFMPICYGGGVTTLEQMHRIFRCGVEKIALNSALVSHPHLPSQAAKVFGQQSIVASIDVKRDWLGRPRIHHKHPLKSPARKLADYARHVESLGVGEILLNSVDRDGTRSGYDLEIVAAVAAAVHIPVIACGGARGMSDFVAAVDAGASAVAAGSLFVFHGRHRAVLVQFPAASELQEDFYAKVARR